MKEVETMSKIAVVYWSGTGNTEAMANEVAEGAKRLVAVEQIYLFKLSTLNIFINRFHFRLLSNQSVLHQFIM